MIDKNQNPHDPHEGKEVFDEDLDLVGELEERCAASELDEVYFEPGETPDKSFATRTFVDIAGQPELRIWSSPDGARWLSVAGKMQRFGAPMVFPGDDAEEAGLVEDLAGQMAGIHSVAEAIFESLSPAEPNIAFDLLNSLAYLSMNAIVEDPGAGGRPWHAWADAFGAHCRLGFLAGVMLEESPFGHLNIRASTIDPVTRKTTHLQVYWKQDDERDEPEHWLAVGTLTGPAHDVDPEYPDLLADTPEGSRDYIRHAIDHLHEMVHLAGSILEARTAEVFAFMDAKADEGMPDVVRHEMIRTTIEDAIAGLNGIARLYTGAMPD